MFNKTGKEDCGNPGMGVGGIMTYTCTAGISKLSDSGKQTALISVYFIRGTYTFYLQSRSMLAILVGQKTGKRSTRNMSARHLVYRTQHIV